MWLFPVLPYCKWHCHEGYVNVCVTPWFPWFGLVFSFSRMGITVSKQLSKVLLLSGAQMLSVKVEPMAVSTSHPLTKEPFPLCCHQVPPPAECVSTCWLKSWYFHFSFLLLICVSLLSRRLFFKSVLGALGFLSFLLHFHVFLTGVYEDNWQLIVSSLQTFLDGIN